MAPETAKQQDVFTQRGIDGNEAIFLSVVHYEKPSPLPNAVLDPKPEILSSLGDRSASGSRRTGFRTLGWSGIAKFPVPSLRRNALNAILRFVGFEPAIKPTL